MPCAFAVSTAEETEPVNQGVALEVSSVDMIPMGRWMSGWLWSQASE